jgi:hypothetical protein
MPAPLHGCAQFPEVAVARYLVAMAEIQMWYTADIDGREVDLLSRLLPQSASC